MGIEQSTQQSIYTPSALQIVLLYVHAPRGLFKVLFKVPFLPHPPSLSDGNPYPAALLRMRGNYFRRYLIEVQHNNENPTTVYSRVWWSSRMRVLKCQPSFYNLEKRKTNNFQFPRKKLKIKHQISVFNLQEKRKKFDTNFQFLTENGKWQISIFRVFLLWVQFWVLPVHVSQSKSGTSRSRFCSHNSVYFIGYLRQAYSGLYVFPNASRC